MFQIVVLPVGADSPLAQIDLGKLTLTDVAGWALLVVILLLMAMLYITQRNLVAVTQIAMDFNNSPTMTSLVKGSTAGVPQEAFNVVLGVVTLLGNRAQTPDERAFVAEIIKTLRLVDRDPNNDPVVASNFAATRYDVDRSSAG